VINPEKAHGNAGPGYRLIAVTIGGNQYMAEINTAGF
jgi:hypothetical protein